MSKHAKKNVFVALSGGVDSSVAAALLQKHGYNVTGVFIKVWQPDFLPARQSGSGGQECSWAAEREDAMRVAALLDIPFLTFDLEEEYKRDIVDYFVAEYKRGNTPNPDVMCNKRIKFGVFYRKAREMGADFIATGHYARIENCTLKIAKDKNKDQTYFLWTLTQDILAHTLFPIGAYKKPEVRKLAAEFGLPTAEKKDSQGLCFIGKLDMKVFLKHFISEKRGDVLDEAGRVIGHHDGALFYTLGERHGFTVLPKSPSEKPHYIIAKDTVRNTLTVSTNEAAAHTVAQKKDVRLTDVNWIVGAPPEGSLTARSRYRQKLFDCEISAAEGGAATATFPHAQPVAPSSQSLVFYRAAECLGGGIIV